MAEQVTVWWIDDHYGMRPATLHSAPGSKSEKQVRYRAGRFGMTHRPIGSVSFTAQDAIDKFRQRITEDRAHAFAEVQRFEAALVRLDEIEDELE